MDGAAGSRKLQKAVERLERAFTDQAPTGRGLDRAARVYRDALHLALTEEPPVAVRLFRSYDARFPAGPYASAFGPGDEKWLASIAAGDDRDVLAVVFELSTRLRLEALQRATRDRLAHVLGRQRDARLLVQGLRRWQELGLLERQALTLALRDHVVHSPLALDAALWTSFFDRLPQVLLPEMSEVHSFLGRGADAVRLADTPAREEEALACCERSPRLVDAEAGLALARRRSDPDAQRRLREHAADLLFAADRYVEAVAGYREVGRFDRVSECHERLGDFAAALAACPSDQPGRLAELAGRGLAETDALVEKGDFGAAARQAGESLAQLDRAAADEAVAARRLEVASQRAAAVAAGRLHYSEQAAAEITPAERATVYATWSRFEEEAGELPQAAMRAEDGNDRYRAHRLYRQAGQFGEAARVLQDDHSAESLTARAAAREAGGDLLGAARLEQQAGRHEEALALYARAGEPAHAAGALIEWRGDEAIEDPRLATWLRRADQVERLIGLCLRAIERTGRGSAAAAELRRLSADGLVPTAFEPAVTSSLGSLDTRARQPFEEHAAAWITTARAEVDARFAGVWGLDLGTTTCAAAIYDTVAGEPVLCTWKGKPHFAATLSLDAAGNEVVGLSGEEIFGGRTTGHIAAAKRAMGSRTRYRVGTQLYRPEEVAARLIRHARRLVEDHLAGQVRERLAALAKAELGTVEEEWLDWAEENHDLRLDRAKALLTIPAYFLNNQKHATRDACRIAGVEAVRLIHEPTAACIAAARSRRLTGRIVVVDLGAGTLDVSALEVADNVYEVQRVLGDNHYGGRDFDVAVSRALTASLAEQGIEVPASGTARQRLDVAAEHLKVVLSSQEHADYTLRSFAGRDEVPLRLDRSRLAEILAEPLRTLRGTCQEFSDALTSRPEHLVLVGGPVLSPQVHTLIERAFGLRRTPVQDPRTAVACGAALQAAVLDGKLTEMLLLDVTPLPLGIRVVDEQGVEQFSPVVDRYTRIPVERRDIYTTRDDGQATVDVEIFNGDLSPRAKVGQFRLSDIPPAPGGVPQIEVKFSIDASCVLEVTARDLGTGRSSSVRVSDTTLLSPTEVDAMVTRRLQENESDAVRQRVRELAARAAEDERDAEATWREFRARLDGHRPAGPPPDDTTAQTLADMFREVNQVELDLMLIREPLRDLAATAERYLQRPAEEPLAALTEGERLAAELRTRLDRLRPQVARLNRWNAVLVRLALAEPDPLRRFRDGHRSGGYATALRALDQLSEPLTDLDDIRRQLHCLAEVGDAEGYRAVLAPHAANLHAIPIELADPERFIVRTRPALVGVTVTRPDGEVATGSGFLVAPGLVATTQLWAGREVDPAEIGVTLETGGCLVERVHLPDPTSRSMIALLRLAEPAGAGAAPLRLGHPKLIRIGDRVWAPLPPYRPGGAHAMHDGIVDKFESFPELGLRLFKTGLPVPPGGTGSPLVNDFGEVVGILTASQQATVGPVATFAVMIDALDPLLAEAGEPRFTAPPTAP